MRPAWSRRAVRAEPGPPSSAVPAARHGPAQRPAEPREDADGRQPPGVDVRDVDEQGGGRQGQRNHDRPAPVVTDDEVVPERAERPEAPAHPAARAAGRTGITRHRAPSSGPAGAAACAVAVTGAAAPGAAATRPRRSSATYARAASVVSGTITSRAAPCPGHDAPAPSAPQKTPNEVSMTPTPNFMLFSGTRDSGACTATPTAATTITAATTLSAARPTSFWLAPNVMAMNTTSSPSSSTPLNDRVNAYQSPTRPRRPPAAALAAATWRA